MKPPPVSRRALWQVVAALLVLVAFMTMVTWLQHNLPVIATPTPQDLIDETPIEEFASCERTLPEDEVAQEESETVEGPVGRISANEVYQCPRRFNGRIVKYVGEVVGDVLRRDGGAWIQVNDDAYALLTGPLPSHREWAGTNTGLAVWVPDELVDIIERPGRRGLRGDIVVVVGVLLRVDPEDGGGLTIRARELRRLAPAREVDPPLHRGQAVVAGLLSIAAFGLIVRERRINAER